MAEWVIREPGRGPVELWCGRRQVGTHPDVSRARTKALDSMEDGDSLFHEEVDGYRTRLKGKRRGWRAEMK